MAVVPNLIIEYIDFHKNNFTLSDSLPQIPYLNGARVRLNREHILAQFMMVCCISEDIFSSVISVW
jgi:hypothetical protein